MNSRCVTFPCPRCKRPHALAYLTGKSGDKLKKTLGVSCDDSGKLAHTRFVPIPQAVLDVSDLTEADLTGIPEFTTAPALAVAASKNNLQFVLMNCQPGQTVERNVDLPRPLLPEPPFSQPEYAPPSASAPDGLMDLPTVAQQIETDDAKAKLILEEISQVQQAQKEVQTQLGSLMTTRTRLEQQERDLRKELRKYWTAPLNFEEKPDVGF